MIQKKETWASISGGKDSTYMLKWIIDNQIQINGFVCALLRNYEEPDMVKHIFRLKELTEMNGYQFIILENKNDIEPFMGEVITQKGANSYGKTRGFPMMVSPCWISRDWKIKLIDRFAKQREVISGQSIIQMIGYTIDEPSSKRQQRIKEYLAGNLTENIKYPLVDMNIKESDCLNTIVESGLYCQTHLDYPRSGCWFCHKAPLKSRLKAICKYPEKRLNDIRNFTKISGKDIYIDITLEEIEAHVSKNIGEINSNEAYNKDLTATQQVASPKSAMQTSLNPDISLNLR